MAEEVSGVGKISLISSSVQNMHRHQPPGGLVILAKVENKAKVLQQFGSEEALIKIRHCYDVFTFNETLMLLLEQMDAVGVFVQAQSLASFMRLPDESKEDLSGRLTPEHGRDKITHCLKIAQTKYENTGLTMVNLTIARQLVDSSCLSHEQKHHFLSNLGLLCEQMSNTAVEGVGLLKEFLATTSSQSLKPEQTYQKTLPGQNLNNGPSEQSAIDRSKPGEAKSCPTSDQSPATLDEDILRCLQDFKDEHDHTSCNLDRLLSRLLKEIPTLNTCGMVSIVEAVSQLENDTFHKALVGSSSREECPHQEPHCPRNSGDDPSAREVVLTALLHKSVEDRSRWLTWNELIFGYNKMASIGKAMMDKFIWQLKDSVKLKELTPLLWDSTASACDMTQTNIVVLAFVFQMMKDEKFAFKQLHFASATPIEKLFSRFMKALYHTLKAKYADLSTVWPSICKKVLEMAVEACKNLAGSIDFDGLFDCITLFVNEFSKSYVEQGQVYAKFIDNAQLPLVELDKIIGAFTSLAYQPGAGSLLSCLGKLNDSHALIKMLANIDKTVTESIGLVIVMEFTESPQCDREQQKYSSRVMDSIEFLKRNIESNSAKACLNRLLAGLTHFLNGLFSSDMTIVNFKLVEQTNRREDFWSIIDGLLLQIPSKPLTWGYGLFISVLEEMSAVYSKFSMTTSTLEKLLADADIFKDVDRSSLDVTASQLGDAQATISSLKKATAFLAEHPNLAGAVEFSKVELFRTLVAGRMKRTSEQPLRTLRDLEESCRQARSYIVEGFQSLRGRGKVTSDMLAKLTDVVSMVKQNTDDDLISSKMVNKSDLETVRLNINLFSILVNCASILKAVAEIETFLESSGTIQNLHDEHGLQDKLSSMSESFHSSGFTPAQADLTTREWKFVDEVGRNTDNLLLMADCLPLFNHFADKRLRHFLDMIINKDNAYAIETDYINSLWSIMSKFGLDHKVAYLDDLLALLASDFGNLAKLKKAGHLLIKASKDLLSDNNNKMQVVNKILSDSTILFRYTGSAYQIWSVPTRDTAEALQMSGSTQDRVSFEDMVDCRIKLDLLRKSNIGAQVKEMMQTADMFVQMVDAIERVADALSSLIKTGSIYKLGQAIHAHIESDAGCREEEMGESNSGSLGKNDLSELWSESNWSLAIVAAVDDPRVQEMTEGQSYLTTGVSTRHFNNIAEALDTLVVNIEKTIFDRKKDSHAIMLFEPSQRFLLCKTLEEDRVNGTKPESSDADRIIESLLRYISNDPADRDLLDKFASPEKPLQHLYYTSDILADRLNKFETLAPPKPSNAANNAGVQICTIGSANEKFPKLLRLLSLYKITEPMSWQFLMASQGTSTEQFRLFLKRAFFDPHNRHYFVVDLHLLSEKCALDLVTLVKKFFSRKDSKFNMNLTLMLMRGDQRSHLYNELLNNNNIFQVFQDSLLTHLPSAKICHEVALKRSATVVQSIVSGMGKSHHILKQADKAGKKLVTILLAGDCSAECIEKRLEELAQHIAEGSSNFLVHIKLDMMDNMLHSSEIIDHILFGMIFLRCVDYRGGFLFFPPEVRFYVELQNSYRKLMIKQVSMLSLCDSKLIVQPPTVEELTKMLDPLQLEIEIDGITHDLLQITAAFLLASNDGMLFTMSLLESKKLLEEQKIIPCSTQAALELIATASQGKIPKQSTFTQLVAYCKIIVSQAIEMDRIPALNSDTYTDTIERILLRSSGLRELRETAVNLIVRLANDLMWGYVEKVRLESKATQKRLTEISPEHPLKDTIEYEGEVIEVKQWNQSDFTYMFFYEQAMKVIYKDSSNIDPEIRNFISEVTNRSAITNFALLTSVNLSKVLLIELVEALSLTTTIKPPKDFIREKEDYDSRLLSYIEEKVSDFKGKGYIITHDNYLKIIMIVQRAHLRIPIVIMGATGCGKTYMIDFIASCLLEEEFCCISMHPGVEESGLIKELYSLIMKATAHPTKRYWVLFDEFNTSPLQCLISEIMTTRKSTCCKLLENQPFPDNIVFVAACNPFRIQERSTNVGLVHESSAAILSHRVYPIPDTLLNNLWDFGQLKQDAEMSYIKCLLASRKRSTPVVQGDVRQPGRPSFAMMVEATQDIISRVISASQKFLRDKGSDNSVSLRDVTRFIALFDYFCLVLGARRLDDAVLLAAHLCYFFRLDSQEHRDGLYEIIDGILSYKPSSKARFDALLEEFAADFQKVWDQSDDVYLNRPLKENLLACTTCIINKMPLIICGKPGTSKTLAAKICTELFGLGEETRSETLYFKRLPILATVDFRGSLTTTSNGVIEAFKRANNLAKKKQAEDILVVLIFDEIGLAEHSLDNPLKVLHSLLEPDVASFAFVGLSNWKLDQSKMNRIIYVARPEMSSQELCETQAFNDIDDKEVGKLAKTLSDALANAYHEFRGNELAGNNSTHANFHGSRDFYESVKIFKRSIHLSTDALSGLSVFRKKDRLEKLMLNAIQRCFGGKLVEGKPSQDLVARLFLKHLNGEQHDEDTRRNLGGLQPVTELIYHNLTDEDCRHMMILTESPQVEDLVVDYIREFETSVRGKKADQVEFIAYTPGREDLFSTFVSRLPIFVEQGYTIILKDLDAVYGCMYDLLNLKYTVQQANEKRCELFYGNRKECFVVHPKFKCVILMDRQDNFVKQMDIDKKQPPPFLNRFEKYLILREHLLSTEQAAVLDGMEGQLLTRTTDTQAQVSNHHLVHNLSKDLFLSVMVKNSKDLVSRLAFSHRRDGIDMKYLITDMLEKASEADSRAANQRAVTSNTSTRSMILQQTVPFYSQNYIILETIRSAYNVKAKDALADVVTLFLQTHPHDSLQALISSLKNSRVADRRAVVFTWTSAWELTEMAERLADVELVNCSHAKINSRFLNEFRLTDKLRREECTIIFQFRSRRDWPLARLIRQFVGNLAERHRCVIIMVAHTQPDDLADTSRQQWSISCLNTSWKMVVIDNLRGCNYEKFFGYLQKPYLDYLKAPLSNESALQQPAIVLDDIVQNGIYKLVTSRANDPKSLQRGSKLISILKTRPALLNHIKTKFLQGIDDKQILANRLNENDLTAQLASTLDVQAIIVSLLSQDLEQRVVDMMRRVDTVVSLDLFSLLTLFESQVAHKIMSNIESVILPRNKSKPAPQIDNSSLKSIPSIKLDMDAYKVKYHSSISKLIELNMSKEGAVSLLPGFIKLYQAAPPPQADFKKSSPENELLTAVYIMDRYLEQSLRAISDDFILGLVADMATICSMLLPNDKDEGDARNLVALMRALTEVFQPELRLLFRLFNGRSEEEQNEIKNKLLIGFEQTGRLDLSNMTNSLRKLNELHSQEEVKRLMKNFKMSESFHSNSSDLESLRLTSGDCMLLKLLEFMSTLGEDDFESSRQVFNGLYKSSNPRGPSFEYFTILCIEGLAFSEYMDQDKMRLFVLSISGYLLEAAISDEWHRQAPCIVNLLLKLITAEKEPLKQITGLLSKIMVTTALKYDSEDLYKKATDQLEGGALSLPTPFFATGFEKEERIWLERQLNQSIVREFDQVIEVEALQGKSQAVGLSNRVVSFHDQIVLCLNAKSLGKVYDVKMLKSLAWLKYDLRCLKVNRSKLSSNEAAKTDHALSSIWNRTGKEHKDDLSAVYLLLGMLVFAAMDSSIHELRKHGFVELSRQLQEWSAKNDAFFIIPHGESHSDVLMRHDRLLQGETMDDEYCQDPLVRMYCLNAISKMPGYAAEDIELLTSRYGSLPHFALFLKSAHETYGNRLDQSEDMEQNASPIPPLSQMRRTYLIGQVLNLLMALPAENKLNWSTAVQGQEPPILINFPVKTLQQYLPIYTLHETKEDFMDPEWEIPVPDFTALWQCLSPGCGNLIAVGDCGDIAGSEEEIMQRQGGAAALCPGCGQLVGVKAEGDNPGMERLDFNHFIGKIKHLISIDDEHFRRIPSDDRDESWILNKYGLQLESRAAAVFARLLQCITVYLFEARKDFREDSHEAILNQIDGQIEVFRGIIEKDEDSTFLYLTSLLYQILQFNSDEPIETPESLREAIGLVINIPASGITKALDEYRINLQQVYGKQEQMNATLLAIVRGNLQDKSIRDYFGSDLVVEMWGMARFKETITLARIYDTLSAERSADRLDVDFLVHLMEVHKLLLDYSAIVTTVVDFSAYLTAKFNMKLEENEAVGTTIGQLIKQECRQAYNEDADDIFDESPANTSSELKERFELFARDWKKHFKVLKDHEKHLDLKFGCTLLGTGFSVLEKLDSNDTPISCYLCADSLYNGANSLIMKILLDALTKFQNDFITKYESLKRFNVQPSASSHIAVNVFHAAPSALLCSVEGFTQDLQAHSRPRVQPEEVDGIEVDVAFLSTKYAQKLFSQTMLLKATPIYQYSDGDSLNLEALINRISARVPLVEPETATLEELKKFEHLNLKPGETIDVYVKPLQLVLAAAVDELALKETDRLEKFMTKDMQVIVNMDRLSSVELSDLKLVVTKFYELGYPEAKKKADTMFKNTIDAAKLPDKTSVASNSLTPEEATRMTWLLKAVFTKKMREVREVSEAQASAALEEALSEAMDHEKWPEKVANLKTLLGMDFEPTVAHVPYLIKQLSTLQTKD